MRCEGPARQDMGIMTRERSDGTVAWLLLRGIAKQ